MLNAITDHASLKSFLFVVEESNESVTNKSNESIAIIRILTSSTMIHSDPDIIDNDPSDVPMQQYRALYS
jgi:hypothetical protein